jgi:KDO2-lipid IV(A) lauroyltransferase
VKRLQHLLEYAAVRTILFVIDLLPVRVAVALANGLGNLAWLVMVRRRRVTIDNLTRAGFAPDAAAARRLSRASFRHFVRVVVTSLKSDAHWRRVPWQQCVEWHVPPEVAALLDDPQQGVILASGHLGSWEVGAQVLSHRKPVLGITRKMNNPYVDRLMLARKPRNRFELTPKRDADLGRLVGALGSGKALAIMIDTHARERGMAVDFFDRPAMSHTAIALLHLVTKKPIVFGWCLEVAPMRFAFHATGPFRFAPSGDKQRDVRTILEHLNRELEAAVRSCPEQYMWGHRRWRVPTGAPQAS